jgi:rRNA maturation endonuclease Nob1
MHFIWGPATVVVLLIVGVLLVLGALLLGGSSRRQHKPTIPDRNTCASCGHRNSDNARFCAKCGNDLHKTAF